MQFSNVSFNHVSSNNEFKITFDDVVATLDVNSDFMCDQKTMREGAAVTP
jgi:hypothetical protein